MFCYGKLNFVSWKSVCIKLAAAFALSTTFPDQMSFLIELCYLSLLSNSNSVVGPPEFMCSFLSLVCSVAEDQQKTVFSHFLVQFKMDLTFSILYCSLSDCLCTVVCARVSLSLAARAWGLCFISVDV